MNFEDIKKEIYKIFEINTSSDNKIYYSIYILYKQLYYAYKQNEYIQYTNTIKLITKNIYEYRKVFIHKFLVLFNFLNIPIDKQTFYYIEDFLILNLLVSFYLYNILLKVISYHHMNITFNNILNYGIPIIKAFFNIIKKQLLKL